MKVIIKYDDQFVNIEADTMELQSTIYGNTIIVVKNGESTVAVANVDDVKLAYISDNKK